VILDCLCGAPFAPGNPTVLRVAGEDWTARVVGLLVLGEIQ